MTTMTPLRNTKSAFLLLGRIGILAILIAATILSGRFASFLNLYGLAFVVIGGVALILTSYDFREIVAALTRAGRAKGSHFEDNKYLIFWESASRNFWMVGVLATLLSFVIALTNSEGGIEGIATRMASSLIPTVYGVILSVICLVPWLKLRETGTPSPAEGIPGENEVAEQRTAAPLRFGNLAGYALIIALILWTLIRAVLTSPTAVSPAWKWVVYWPSLLVILGGTIALVLFVGSSANGRTLTLGFAVTGLIGSLMGIIQVLLGFSSRKIGDISLGVTFILSCCFFALLGMMLLGAPLEDRSIKDLKKAKHSTLSRAAWWAFPLVTLIFLVITFVLVVTPMKK